MPGSATYEVRLLAGTRPAPADCGSSRLDPRARAERAWHGWTTCLTTLAPAHSPVPLDPHVRDAVRAGSDLARPRRRRWSAWIPRCRRRRFRTCLRARSVIEVRAGSRGRASCQPSATAATPSTTRTEPARRRGAALLAERGGHDDAGLPQRGDGRGLGAFEGGEDEQVGGGHARRRRAASGGRSRPSSRCGPIDERVRDARRPSRTISKYGIALACWMPWSSTSV